MTGIKCHINMAPVNMFDPHKTYSLQLHLFKMIPCATLGGISLLCRKPVLLHHWRDEISTQSGLGKMVLLNTM